MTVRLTEFSHGAGCGCKISPKVLDSILRTQGRDHTFPDLLVGNDKRDDAAVFAIDRERAVISTTDFFMPIVDDPHDFGSIAAVNAISDIYAMGGKPIMAVSILGWPVDKLPAELASQVIEGARQVCRKAGIPLAGGHSIDSREPIFGLAVTGMVDRKYIKSNDKATPDSVLYLTKPLGIGILTTAQKKNIVHPEDMQKAIDQMLQLNDLGMELGRIPGVKAMTDVTGFGLLGHLLEICEGSQVSAEIEFKKVPTIPGIEKYIEQHALPGGTHRNFDSYGSKMSPLSDVQKAILCDPQTSGGLLIAVQATEKGTVERILKAKGIESQPFGIIKGKGKLAIEVV